MTEPSPIIATVSGGVTGAMMSQFLPGVEPPMILASLTGSFIFFSISNSYTIIKRVGLFFTSFIAGLMFTNTVDGIYITHYHSVVIDKPVWSFLISAFVVTVIVGILKMIRDSDVLITFVRRVFNIRKGDDQ